MINSGKNITETAAARPSCRAPIMPISKASIGKVMVALTGPLEHLEVLGYGRLAHGERLRQLADGGLPLRQPGENGAAGGIGQSRKGGVELLFITHKLNN